MANWPSIATPSYGSGGELYKPQVQTEFEANYGQSRPAVTRTTIRWPLHWESMSAADFATLQTFFNTNQGNQITNFPEPETGTMYTIRFLEDRIRWTWNEYGGRTVDVLVGTI